MNRKLVPWFALAFSLAPGAGPAAGQDTTTAVSSGDESAPAQMEGSVIGMPGSQRLPNSLVLLDNGRRSRTDLNGRFAFPGLTAGTYRVLVVAPGCQMAYASVELEPWQTRRIGLVVEFHEEAHAAEVRRRSSEGLVVTADEISDMNVERLSEVLRRVAPTMVGRPGSPGSGASLSGARGNPSALGMRPPVLVVDGMRRGESNTRALDEINPDDVAYLEILKGAGGGWNYGSDGQNGVISVTTKRGVASDAPAIDPEMCRLPDWP